MRRKERRVSESEARALIERAEFIVLAGTGDAGQPILRTFNGVVLDDWVYFHGAPKGEKIEAVGRPVVIGAEEHIAAIPSYFRDPERACPATTYYRSAQVSGTLEAVTDLARKAAVLTRLMAKFQPEGGHVPITADAPMYRAVVKNLFIAGLPLTNIVGKFSCGQQFDAEALGKVISGLWGRGDPGDLRAIETVLRRNPHPAPAFLAGPGGTRLVPAMTLDDLAPLEAGLAAAYWNTERTLEQIRAAHANSAVWVGARGPDGAGVATARALSDGSRAYLLDVFVAPAYRGRGVGAAVMRLLLDHPTVKRSDRVWLHTDDAVPFYRKLGFETDEMQGRVRMALSRATARARSPASVRGGSASAAT